MPKESGKLTVLVNRARNIIDERNELSQELKKSLKNALSSFDEQNIFRFPIRFDTLEEYISFVINNLQEYIEEDKIEDVHQQVQKNHAALLNQLTQGLNKLFAQRDKIDGKIRQINQDFQKANFVKAIEEFEMRSTNPPDAVVKVLEEINDFRTNKSIYLSDLPIFRGDRMEESKAESIRLLTKLMKRLNKSKQTEINLADIFGLQFRAKQNGKETGWKDRLSDVGSTGTDILLKAMIYIMLLNVSKNEASKKSKFKNFKIHCIIDEVDRIHAKNVKGLIEFANVRGIWMLFGSPNEVNASVYKYVYEFNKNDNSLTNATRLLMKLDV